MKATPLAIALLIAALVIVTSFLKCGPAQAGNSNACLSLSDKPCDTDQPRGGPVKAVILRFVDPQDTETGLAVSRLLWREVVFAILDVKAALVHSSEFAEEFRDRYGKSPTSYLDEQLHTAAIEIARLQKANMSMWGATIADNDVLTIYSFLSVIPEALKENFGLSLSLERDGRKSGGRPSPLVAPLSQTDFNFDPQVVSRRKLLAGSFRLRCALSDRCPKGIAAYTAPRDSVPVTRYFREGDVVQVRNIIGKWMEIEIGGGEPIYINIYHADIAPPAIFVREPSILRRNPTAPERIDSVLNGAAYNVQAMEWTGREGARQRWFKIRTLTKEGWVSGDSIEPLYRFPATHFVAGLFRYAAGQFKEAEHEFNHFLETMTSRSDNVLRSSTLQLISACWAQIQRHKPLGTTAPALVALDDASKLTPFDPAIYNMRALILLSLTGKLSAAVPDLKRSVQLARNNTATGQLITQLVPTALASLGIVSDPKTDSELVNLREQVSQAQIAGLKEEGEIASIQAERKFVLPGDVLFPEGGYKLSSQGQSVLKQYVSKLKSLKKAKISVYGFTENDPVGPALQRQGISDNLALSTIRASSVASYLVSQGINPGIISAKGFGDMHPIAPNDTPLGRAENRRIEIAIQRPDA
jgi:chemotaxis protein MotB